MRFAHLHARKAGGRARSDHVDNVAVPNLKSRGAGAVPENARDVRHPQGNRKDGDERHDSFLNY